MKKFVYILLSLFSIPFWAQEKITLEKCYELVEKNYPLAKQNQLLQSQSELQTNILEKEKLPKIALNAQATYQSEVTQVPFSMPNATIEPLNKDQYRATLDVNQLLYNGGNIKAQTQLKASQIKTQQKLVDINLYQLKNLVNQYYFGLLLGQEKEELLLTKRKLLQEKSREIQRKRFGKTSIKNYLHHVLKNKYKVYKTPRSVNTIAGIILDVNKDLPLDTQIYIAEAGAREKGDIEEISMYLEPEICIIGSVGEQHIEYFKTIDNIIHTKMEILNSPNMKMGFVHESVPIKEYPNIMKYPNNLHIVKSNLDGIWFDVEVDGKIEHFHAPILGNFNAINLTAVILVSHYLGMSIDEIKMSLGTLPQVEHRLQKIEAGGKIIIDDSFNGNLEGMLEAVNICSTYSGRKVIITPGLVESTDEANILLAKAINENFDFVILTGSLNTHLFSANIDKEKVYVLKDKSLMEATLAKTTKIGDLILFANDAPNFI